MSHRDLTDISLWSRWGFPVVSLRSCWGRSLVSPVSHRVCPCGPGLTVLSGVPHQGLTPGSHRGFAGVLPWSLSHWDLGCRSPRMLATCFNAAVVPRPQFLNKFMQWLKVNLCACVRCSPLGERCFRSRLCQRVIPSAISASRSLPPPPLGCPCRAPPPPRSQYATLAIVHRFM